MKNRREYVKIFFRKGEQRHIFCVFICKDKIKGADRDEKMAEMAGRNGAFGF